MELTNGKTVNYRIRTGTINEAVWVSKQIPELKNPYAEGEYEKRMSKVPHLVLVAEDQAGLLGFKVAYQRTNFMYSWMGGVLPRGRRQGIAKALADHQEAWARKQGYQLLRFKTRNYLTNMLLFALGNGFRICGYEAQPDPWQDRIWLEKELQPIASTKQK
ncbi:MAG: GNAT family N-acetyltransferase [Bacteroidota bacterium]